MMRPLGNRVLVKRIKPRPSLIILTDEDPHKLARVLAVGPGKVNPKTLRLTPTCVKPGDVVMIPGIALTVPDYEEGQEFLVTEDDIAGVVA